MKNDFFTYSRRKIKKDKEKGRFDAAHNREMALRCFIKFYRLGKHQENRYQRILINIHLTNTRVTPYNRTMGCCHASNSRPVSLQFRILIPFHQISRYANCEVKSVRENVMRALKRIATRCNLSVVPSMGMVKDIYQRAIDRVSVTQII